MELAEQLEDLPQKREFWKADGWMVLCNDRIRYFSKRDHYTYTYQPMKNKSIKTLLPVAQAGWIMECVAHCHYWEHPRTWQLPWPCPINHEHQRIIEMRLIPFAIRGQSDKYTWLFFRHHSCGCDINCKKCRKGE